MEDISEYGAVGARGFPDGSNRPLGGASGIRESSATSPRDDREHVPAIPRILLLRPNRAVSALGCKQAKKRSEKGKSHLHGTILSLD